MSAATNQVRWLANLRRKVRVAMLHTHYVQQVELIGQINQQHEQLAVELDAACERLRELGDRFAELGVAPPIAPDYVAIGATRCEP